MRYTVDKFYRQHHDQIRLIAGESGLDRIITSAGILDYEFIPSISSRYQHNSFIKGQLVMTTFLYAKDNPGLIAEAVRQLKQKECSGLIIKNIFRLEITDHVKKICDAQQFPVFVLGSRDYFYEDFIREVSDNVALYDSREQQEKRIARILNTENEQERVRHLLALFPDIQSEYRCWYVDQDIDIDRSELVCLAWQGGTLVIESCGMENSEAAVAEQIHQQKPDCWYGVSDLHYVLAECDEAIREARYALQVKDEKISRFSELGMYRMLLNVKDSPQVRRYASSVLEPLQAYDYETGSHLQDTLETWVDKGGSLQETAEALSSHVNTIRYRMDKISELTGLDYRKAEDMCELILVCRINRIVNIL